MNETTNPGKREINFFERKKSFSYFQGFGVSFKGEGSVESLKDKTHQIEMTNTPRRDRLPMLPRTVKRIVEALDHRGRALVFRLTCPDARLVD